MIAILAAMKDEVRPLRSLGRKSHGAASVTVTGVGKRQALAAAEALFASEPRPTVALSLGFAGALSDDLNAGDLVLARRIYAVDGPEPLTVDRHFYQLAEDAIHENILPYVRRDTLTAPGLVRTRAHRERLSQEYKVQAVSMEDYWICYAASRAGVPFVSVKAVLDTTRRELPPYVEELMWRRDAGQSLPIMFSVLARPTRIPTLMWMGRASKKARRSLELFAKSFVGKAIQKELLSSA